MLSQSVGQDIERQQPREAGHYVQYGAGFCCPPGWINFDASPRLRVARVPLLGGLLGNGFPAECRYGCIVKGLPIAAGSVRGLYASHVLEHLSLAEMRIALRNSFRMLSGGGIFRLVVPDLRGRAAAYLASDDPEAAHSFMTSLGMGVEEARNTVLGRLRGAFGNSRHLWMWDHDAMARELEAAGFVAIRSAEFGDSGDPMFDLVEERDRFFSGDLREVAIQASKPLD